MIFTAKTGFISFLGDGAEMVLQQKPLATAQLQFDDGASCQRWLATLPLTNVASAQHTLTQQITLARQAGLPGVELLRIMETLREPVAYVHAA